MMGTDLRPTFSSWTDRAIYLLAEFKLLIAGLVVAGTILIAAFRGDLPTPAWLKAVAGATLLLAIPCYVAGRRIAKWLRNRHYVEVYEVDGLRDTREKWLVPPAIWEDKTVEGPSPNPVNDNGAFEVRSFEWHDGVGELVVEGTWPGEAKTGDLVTEKTHFEEMHDHLLDGYRQLKQLRAKWSRMARDLEGQTINAQAEANERGTMMDKTAAKDIYEEAKEVAEQDAMEEEDLPSLTDEQEREEFGQPIDEPRQIEDGSEL